MGVLCCHFRPKMFSPTESEPESSDSSSSGSTSSDESRQEDSDVDSMSSSSEEEEEEEEEEEGNDVEVVWAKRTRGVWGLGHVFDGKLYFTRDICEEKWIPKDLVPPKKSVAAPKATMVSDLKVLSTLGRFLPFL